MNTHHFDRQLTLTSCTFGVHHELLLLIDLHS